jgi:mannosylglycerate synthase
MTRGSSSVADPVASLVVFPFKTEDPDVVLKNIQIAANHVSVAEVLCVGSERGTTYGAVEAGVSRIAENTGTPVTLTVQDRIGTKRPGKGDGMNTGLRHFVDGSHDRLHFYDSDITSFDATWITKAEEATDDGFNMVRHYFPRSSTDGMVTWMITRPGFAFLFPNSDLSRIDQPLGGELLLSREAAETIASDPMVRDQSDWGIDTLITFSAVKHGMSMAEVYIPQGKIHKLYGQLTDIRRMVIECFSAMQALRGQRLEQRVTHHVELPGKPPTTITDKIGYDYESTLQLLPPSLTARQLELMSTLSKPVNQGMISAHTGQVSFMDEALWHDVYLVLLDEFVPDDKDWEEVLFLLWVVRVLAYTTDVAMKGYQQAMDYLQGTIRQYRSL